MNKNLYKGVLPLTAIVGLGVIAQGEQAQAYPYLSSSSVVLMKPYRALDTRETGRVTRIQLEAPADWVDAVAANVVVVSDGEPGYLTLWDCVTLPDVSHLNFGANETESNFALSSLSATDELCLYMSAPGDVVVDVFGWTTEAGYYDFP
jgi:hypothetical protein